jgi:acetoacetate decarboxylase
MAESNAPKIDPGDILGWPILKIDYPTEPANIAKLLPPGIEPSDEANVHLSIYNFPVPDEPEFGIVTAVDADYNGEKGMYTLGYGIDQESAIFISQELNGQPKYPADIEYWRMGPNVRARCVHQGYTFVELRGQSTGVQPNREPHSEVEWWIKSSRAAGGAEKSYDFPPHVVKVKTDYQTVYQEGVDIDLVLGDSPWDPIGRLLPVAGDVTAKLCTFMFLGRTITLEGPLDPDAFWPHADTIGGSRWPGERGGPKR